MQYVEACRELNVSPSASHQEIKNAHRRLVRKYHPDLNLADPKAIDRFHKIQQAYDLLIAQGPNPSSTSLDTRGNSAVPWPGNRVPLQAPVHGQDITGLLRATLQEVFTGTTAEIVFDDLEACPRCGATGAEPASAWIPCPPCQGMPSGHCEWCAGSGRVPSQACTTCQGAGVSQTTRTVRVVIPRSSPDGQAMRVKNKGGWGIRDRGSIKVDLRIESDPNIIRRGDDLQIKMPVNVLQAILGGEAEVKGLDDDPYRIVVTPGSSSGKRFRLKERGMYRSSKGQQRGDLFAIVEIQVPEQLTDRQRQLYEMLLAEEV